LEEKKMRARQKRTVVLAVVCIAVIALVGVVSTASGQPHVTSATLTSGTMASLSVMSTGDAGAVNNLEPATSLATTPVALWFNQDVLVTNPVIVDPDLDNDIVLGGAWWMISTDLGTTWSTPTTFDPVAGAIASAQGIYSIEATGADDDDPSLVVTGSVNFGIDKTAPTSRTDLPPLPADSDAIVVFNQTATVTITATDTLSGVERLQYSVDNGPFDYAWDAPTGLPFMVPVTVTTPGFHTLTWKVWDNAGNVSVSSARFIVRPAGFIPSVSLGIKQSGSRRRIVQFTGEVSTMYANMTLKITVQRKVGRVWRSYTTYSTTIPAFSDDYSITKTISRAGTFRAWATFGGSSTRIRTFTTL
jgi:hypothetical protein